MIEKGIDHNAIPDDEALAESEGIEPSSKLTIQQPSTCLVIYWISNFFRETPTYKKILDICKIIFGTMSNTENLTIEFYNNLSSTKW